MSAVQIRFATIDDVARICEIHNEGIVDRVATLDLDPHTLEEETAWFTGLKPDEFVLVYENNDRVEGFAANTRYSPRQCYDGVGVLSIYISRQNRGQGVGTQLLGALIDTARAKGYRKIILRACVQNARGIALYEKLGFEKVGIHRKHGYVDNNWVDILVMEIIL